jgi:hypothetical protein
MVTVTYWFITMQLLACAACAVPCARILLLYSYDIYPINEGKYVSLVPLQYIEPWVSLLGSAQVYITIVRTVLWFTCLI